MIKVQVSKAYLELARINLAALSESVKGLPDNDKATTLFAFSSLVVNYSYSAIEAFTNRNLYDAWIRGIELCRDQKYAVVYGYNNDRLREFYEEHKEIVEFKKFKDTNLRELKKRINKISDLTDTPRICDENQTLWQEFNLFLKENRHFLIHPDSTDQVFSEMTNQILNIGQTSQYPRIASEVIGHFFKHSKKGIPAYLNQNELFRIEEINILPLT